MAKDELMRGHREDAEPKETVLFEGLQRGFGGEVRGEGWHGDLECSERSLVVREFVVVRHDSTLREGLAVVLD